MASPCSFAYNYARIRWLVCLVSWLYRSPVAAHSANGFSSLDNFKARQHTSLR